MRHDAEQQLAAILATDLVATAKYKLRNDSRVTLRGAFLRKSSLDDLAQPVSVLRSEMSLFGLWADHRSEACMPLRIGGGQTTWR